MKTILLHVFEDSGFQSRLQVALDLARHHDAHLTCVQPTTQFAPMSFGPMGGDFVSSISFEEMDAAERAFREKIEKQLHDENVSWDWQTGLGDPATLLTEHSRLADLVVVSQSFGKRNAGDEPLPIAGDISVYADCATFVVPAKAKGFDCSGAVLVAWNGSAEAARAIKHARALLAAADDVHIVTVGDHELEFPSIDASCYLARYGISSTLHEIKGKAGEVADILDEFAATQNVAAMVMGAYGHSRLRETLFGGVTKDVLKNSKIPLIMGH